MLVGDRGGSLRRDSSSPAVSSCVLQAVQCQCLSRNKGNGFNVLRDSWGAFVLGIAQRKDLGLRERSLVTWQGGRVDVLHPGNGQSTTVILSCGCLAPWQHSKVGLLKENLEACAKEELSQYRKSLVTLSLQPCGYRKSYE